MKLQRKFENQIKKKLQEIETLEVQSKEIDGQIREAKAYIQALEDMKKHISRAGTNADSTPAVRTGSAVDKALQVLRAAGKPLHANEILKLMGREVSKGSRQALSGQISNYVRQGRIFTRTAPNTFGIIEWDSPNADGFGDSGAEEDSSTNPVVTRSPPEGFGKMRSVT